ncbi:MAG: DUF2130 domain-containing protein [Steroidobacteraceae bacterium]
MSSESLLLASDTRVICPKCEHEFSLEQGFAKQALESIEASSASGLAALKEQERTSVEKRAQELAGEQARAAQRQVEDLRRLLKEQGEASARALTEVRALTEQAFQPQLSAMKEQLAASQAKLAEMDRRETQIEAREKNIEARIQESAAVRAAELVAGERQGYESRLADAQAQLQSLRAEQIALREERQRLKDEKDALALEVQKQVDAKLSERESLVRAQEQERATLDKAELQKKLDDAVVRLADATRRMEQGSQQLQGEVLELAIEEALRRAFALDTIEEVKKGVRGGDVIQRVATRAGQQAGIILWETKRAKDWSPQWISKLKEDMRSCGAAVGVLVTMSSAIPRGWESGQLFALHEEVWVTTWSPALQLAAALRAGVLDLHKQRLISAGKGEKMEAVYDYLTSVQFAQKLKAVYGAFRALQEDLAKERAAAEQRFARREKLIATGVKELLGFAGDVQGLSQQQMPQLEMENMETPPGSP